MVVVALRFDITLFILMFLCGAMVGYTVKSKKLKVNENTNADANV